MRYRFRLPALIAVAALTPLGLSGTVAAAHSPAHVVSGQQPALTVAQVLRLAAHATDRSIIIFKNQLTNLPARGATEALRIRAAGAAEAPRPAPLAPGHAAARDRLRLIHATPARL